MKICGTILFVAALIVGTSRMNAQGNPIVVVLQEEGFPSADSAVPAESMLRAAIPGAQIVSAAEMPAALEKADCRLLVLPYGSAFPEAAWPQLLAYLNRGGNLLVLGGRPFTRAAYRDLLGWHLRDYSVRFIRELAIDNYTAIPGSGGLQFRRNSEMITQLPAFSWSQAFSPIIHLSSAETDSREGAAGLLSARLDAFAWGDREGLRVSVPAVQIDHLRDRFQGGRWVFLNSEVSAAFYEDGQAGRIMSILAGAAKQGAEEFTVRPSMPLYLPGEGIPLEVHWIGNSNPSNKLIVQITLTPETEPAKSNTTSIVLPTDGVAQLPPVTSNGFHRIEAKLLEGSRVRAVYHAGFWMRDVEYLRSGPRLDINQDFLLVNGKPLAVVGTTYMASDVQRQYFDDPNADVWDRDMQQISAAGINMIRTGWWTGWSRFIDESGNPSERTLRTVEAFLMTARKHNLPVQFNLFAFLPDVLGGKNAYLDPVAVGRQKTLISALAQRFGQVPFLAWDLINEPSFTKTLWSMRANGDSIELAAWNDWLRQRHPDFQTLAHQWNVAQLSTTETVPVPTGNDFTASGIDTNPSPVMLYDFYHFAQDVFSNWAGEMRQTFRAAGSQQLITVGQDEHGETDGLSPAFYGAQVDFTTNHSWWLNDALLWDSLVAKQPKQAMLIQETGIMRQLSMDLLMRQSPESAAALLERKFALSLVQGSGTIQWLWNTNDYMLSGNEAQIGILRADRTEKPEGRVMRGFARFSQAVSGSLQSPCRPDVAIIASQAAQFSALRGMQIDAQRNAVLAASYYDRVPTMIIAESQLPKLGSPRLAILPSAQALSAKGWKLLLDYVRGGGNLLVTGSVDRDEYFHQVNRASSLIPGARIEPVTARNNLISIDGHSIEAVYGEVQTTWLEAMAWEDGSHELKDVGYGKGQVFWMAYPIEGARNLDAIAEVYRGVFTKLGIEPAFELLSPLSPGVLIYPTQLQDAILYVMVSESSEDAEINLRDKTTGKSFKLHLSSGHAATALIRKSDGTLSAKYGFD